MLLPFDFQTDPFLILDFSVANPDLAPNQQSGPDLRNTGEFTTYVFGKLTAAGVLLGVGGYGEHRVIYRRSEHFQQTENTRDGGPREIHLGIDLWATAGTPVFAPLDGVVHSFQDNVGFGNYGPTIILEHTAADQPRYSLYGHLTRQSLTGLYEGKAIKTGEKLAEIGPYPENGDWPPHLHFQLMTDMMGGKGDFPGVCSVADRATFLAICPDPNSLLHIRGL